MINVDALKRIVGDDYVVTQRDQIQGYLADETYLGVLPKPADNVVVVKPANPQEIAAILKLANEEMTPVYPRGGRYIRGAAARDLSAQPFPPKTASSCPLSASTRLSRSTRTT